MEKLLTILRILPALILAIKAVEDAIPGEGKGEAKLRLVRETMERADATIGALWPILAGVISDVVRTLNDTGVFKKKSDPALIWNQRPSEPGRSPGRPLSRFPSAGAPPLP